MIRQSQSGILRQVTIGTSRQVLLDWVIPAGLLAAVAFLFFYNLKYNPRPWHDEGAALSLSKTLAATGVYAVQTSEGYQTFGPVQSVGPTVILPVALSFKLFGPGLVQGRIVAAGYALVALVIFYMCGLKLFGKGAALVATFLLLGSPSVGLLLFGRQVLGEVPALAFFLTGWLVWATGIRTENSWSYPIAGLFFGAAMVTKGQYIIIGFGTLALLLLLDLIYYRQGGFMNLLTVGIIAFVCVATWWSWQMVYFGIDTFQENGHKLQQLAKVTTGFHLDTTIGALQFLFGSSGPIYYFWAVPAFLYVGFLSLRRDKYGFILAFLPLFTGLWLGYFILWIIPWPHYALPPIAILALFVGKLYFDLANGFASSKQLFWNELRQLRLTRFTLTAQALVTLGTLTALTTMALLVINQFQKTIRTDVLDTVGEETTVFRNLPQLQSPHQLAAFLNEKFEKGLVIETWERELDILTDQRFHFPDQSLLAQAHAMVYRNASQGYGLGAEYFSSVRASYVIIGWYARLSQVYDTDFLAEHSDLILTVGENEWRYDVYELSSTSLTEQGLKSQSEN